MNFSTVGLMIFLGAITTIICTILAYKFIIPEKKRGNLNKLGQFLSDVFNFKFLIVEKILQFFYVLSTIACVCGGLFMIFGIEVYHSSYYDRTYTDWYGFYGILLALFGPIVIRLTFESAMLFILLVKNVMQINKKLASQTTTEEYQMPSIKDLVSKDNFNFIKDIKKPNKDEA